MLNHHFFILAMHSAIFLSFLVFTNAQIKSAKGGERFGPVSNNLYKLTEGIDQFSLFLLQVILFML